jgi:FimV-like protein
MVNLSGFKKAAVKLFYGGLPDGKIESAIAYFEKCRNLDPYFMLNYLDLAKAYVQDNKPPKAIEVLQKLVKLPIRTADDAAYKEEGKKMLTELQ